MQSVALPERLTLSIVIPCFNEERTLRECVERVQAIGDDTLALEIVIVDDCSSDDSLRIANDLSSQHKNVRVCHHATNQGKGAALRTGFLVTTGDLVAVQDADLEYNPNDLKRLIGPFREGRADVVVGSRFIGSGPHRVLYFWHYLGNAVLTLLSNMFTDLNLTDMESCYKVFRRDVIRAIVIEENRFGFEPEIVAKIAHKELRVFEMAISYEGRTYADGKKITWRDGVRALYCIVRYNAYRLPLPVQFFAYTAIASMAAGVNLLGFLVLLRLNVAFSVAAIASFAVAAATNYFLCVALLFRHKARWSGITEILMYVAVVSLVGLLDLGATTQLYGAGMPAWLAKSLASLIGLVFNFVGRRFIVF